MIHHGITTRRLFTKVYRLWLFATIARPGWSVPGVWTFINLDDPSTFRGKSHPPPFEYLGLWILLAGIGLFFLGILPLMIWEWLYDQGHIQDDSLAGVFGPMVCCCTPFSFILIVIGLATTIAQVIHRVRNPLR